MNITEKVVEWARVRGIFDKATRETQMLKTVEEVGELANAIGKRDLAETADAIGDIAVTLILQAEMNGLDFNECLKGAYEVIAKRKGKMENGVFVKDAENEPEKPVSARVVVSKPEDVEDDTWRDFQALRREKKAKITETALAQIRKEADAVGWSMNDALKECCARGWRGFKGEWVAPKATGGGYGESGKL